MNPRTEPLRLSLLLSSLLLVLGTATASAEASQMVIPNGKQLDFTVLRDGKQVGTEQMAFTNSKDGLGVEIKTNVEVKIAFIPVYHFTQESHELWRGGHLAALDSKTDDDGTKHTLAITTGKDGLNVVGDGKTSTVNTAIVPASLWPPGTAKVGDTKLLNTLDGHLMSVNVRYDGEENVQAGAKSVKARHFVVTGELKRELWYDTNWMLVKARFKGSDGSDIQYVLK